LRTNQIVNITQTYATDASMSRWFESEHSDSITGGNALRV
jgi:hypothetical protein